jgi:REP element-mobilizing transposase RayT
VANESNVVPGYDPHTHHRRSTRLKGYDYAVPGAYFVTICTAEREQTLGYVAEGRIVPSQIGTVVRDCWRALPRRFRHIDLDEWCVMPNHVHGIIFIIDDPPGPRGGRHAARLLEPPPDSEPASCGTPSASSPVPTTGGKRLAPGSLGVIVRAFKASSTRRVNRIRGSTGASLWQRGYHDRIIRNERELSAIRRYIADNPISWELDRDNPARFSTG